MCRVIKVTGNSLTPIIEEGDFVLVLKIPFSLWKPRPGEVIVFRHPVYGTMIKQVERFAPGSGEINVIGTHPDSTDSRQFGPIRRQDVVGRVVWQIRKPAS